MRPKYNLYDPRYIQETDYCRFPSPCYILEEKLLRRNLSLIHDVATEAGVEIILAFKAYALWKTFPIFREYISHTTASSVWEARLAFEEFGSNLTISIRWPKEGLRVA